MKHVWLCRVVLILAVIALLAVFDSSAAAGPRVGGHNPPIGGGSGGSSTYSPPPAYVVPAPATPADNTPNVRFYYAPSTEKPAPAHIAVRVPANAEIWFDGEKTSQTGSDRLFVTPSVPLDQEYTYKVRVVWTQDGRAVERIRSLVVRAGDRANLDFLSVR